MSQLQVTGEAKIRDIQGPVVANSGVVTALDGDASQYVRGDGTLADFPTSTGGGSSVSYYLNSSVSQGTIGGVAYRQLGKTPISGAGTDITISANGYIASYITDANDPALLEVPAGNFNCEFYFSVNNNTGNPFTYAEVYKYDGTTFTLIGTSVGVPEYINQGTVINPYYFAVPVAQSVLTVTDRIAIRIYVNVDGRTVTLHTENNHLCQVVTTFSKGLISLNNLTRQVQFFGTGTSGTDFNISSVTATHTFNLPVASAANTGKLSLTDWSTFNNKQNAITLTTTGTSGAATLVGATLNIPNYTTDLSGYLPLTGGTLTGALNGTTASFTGSLTAQRGNFNQGAASGYAISMQNRNANQEWGLIVDTDAVDDKNLGLYSSAAAMYILRIAASTGAATFFSRITSNNSIVVNRVDNGDYLALKIENRPITAGNTASGFIAFYSNSGDATNDTYSSGRIYSRFDTNSYNSARISLATVTGNEIYQDVLTAKDTNVGIGTINPAETLDLYTTSATANGVGTAIQIQSAGTGANQGWVGVNKGTGNGLTFSVQNNSIIFNTDASTKFGGTERFRINSTDAVFTNPLSVITNDNNFAFNVQLRNNNTGTQALTGLGLSDSSNVRKGQVLWVPSNYVTASLRNSFLVSSVTNVPLILCADATGADTPNIKFQSGAQDKMVMIGSSGNFGIGTSSPKERFEIAGLTANIRLYGRSGVTQNQLSSNLYYDGTTWVRDNNSFGAVVIQLDSTSGNLIFNTTALTSGFPAERLRINSSGNVGINTNSPNAKLQVAGENSLGIAYFYNNSGTAGVVPGVSIEAGTNSSDYALAVASSLGSTYLRVRGDGNVGIGTTAPLELLHLQTTLAGSSGVGTAIQITSGGAGGDQAWIGVNKGTGNGLEFSVENRDIIFNTGATTPFGGSERMRITSGGNVGIGTSSPVSYAGYTTFTVSSPSNSGVIAVRNSAGTAGLNFSGDGNVARIDAIDSTKPMVFTTGDVERARITSGGNVGIGTTSPSVKLEVISNANTFQMARFENSNNTSGNGVLVTSLGSNCNNISSYHLIAATGGADKMYVYGNGNIVNTNGSYGTLSDISLKENIKDASSKLADILKLKVRNFNLIGDDTKQIGFIAQEFEEVFPSMVDLDGKSGKKAIKTSVLVPMLVKAIQEQTQIIKDLEARIVSLESK